MSQTYTTVLGKLCDGLNEGGVLTHFPKARVVELGRGKALGFDLRPLECGSERGRVTDQVERCSSLRAEHASSSPWYAVRPG